MQDERSMVLALNNPQGSMLTLEQCQCEVESVERT